MSDGLMLIKWDGDVPVIHKNAFTRVLYGIAGWLSRWFPRLDPWRQRLVRQPDPFTHPACSEVLQLDPRTGRASVIHRRN